MESSRDLFNKTVKNNNIVNNIKIKLLDIRKKNTIVKIELNNLN